MAVVEYDPQIATLPMMTAAAKLAGSRVGGAETRIGIENLRCASCVRFIEDELRGTSGVLAASVDLATQEARVEYLPQQTVLAQLQAAIEAWGYKPRSASSNQPVDQQEAAHAREYRRLMRKFWFAAAVSLPVLLFPYPQYLPVLQNLPMEAIRLAWGLSAVVTLPVLFW